MDVKPWQIDYCEKVTDLTIKIEALHAKWWPINFMLRLGLLIATAWWVTSTVTPAVGLACLLLAPFTVWPKCSILPINNWYLLSRYKRQLYELTEEHNETFGV